MSAFLVKVDKDELLEATVRLRGIIDRIKLDGQYSAEVGLEFFSEFTRLLHQYRNNIFSIPNNGDRLYESSVVSFITMLIEETTTKVDVPRPVTPFRDVFELEPCEYSFKKLNHKDIQIISSMEGVSVESFVQSLAKVRSFSDLILITKLLFGID